MILDNCEDEINVEKGIALLLTNLRRPIVRLDGWMHFLSFLFFHHHKVEIVIYYCVGLVLILACL